MRDSLEKQFVKNNHLTIQCDLTVIRLYNLSENRVPMTEIPVPLSDIKVHFGKLLEDKKGADVADVTFVVAGQTFDAHKAILAARSPVFMEELYGLTTGDIGAGPRTVENMKPLVFRDLLHFIYTDTLAFMCDPQGVDYCVRIINLLVAANRYAMDRLNLICEDILAKMLNMEAAGTTVDLAQSHNLHKLKEDCIEFMASLCERDVVQACALLKRSCPSFVTAVFERRE
jgi:speckle-type POZ protein